MRSNIKFLILCVLILCISGCAKREPETLISIDESKLVDIKELSKDNNRHIRQEVGASAVKLYIDADVFIPGEIKIGEIAESFPDISLIENALCEGKKLEEISENEWAERAQGQIYEYERYYQIDASYANYYNAALKMGKEVSGSSTVEGMKKKSELILEDCEYPAILSFCEINSETNGIALFYTPSLDGIPIVSQTAGLGGTQLYMASGEVSEMLMERRVEWKGKTDKVTIISVDDIIEVVANLYQNGDLSPLMNGDVLRFIRLAYYVDEEKNIKPVWCFSIDFMNTGREYVVYCIDAQTGTIVFDYNNYAVEGEGE